jgi:hypothetical protein
MLMLSHPRHAQRALDALCRLLARWARTRSVYRLPPSVSTVPSALRETECGQEVAPD